MHDKTPPAPSTSLDKIVAHCKEYGFIFPSSELYGHLQGVYDYGPYGAALKENIRSFWRLTMLRVHTSIVGLDAAILMHPKVWKASGHLDGFDDLFVDNKDSKKRYRVDVLLEEHALKMRQQDLLADAKAFTKTAHMLLHREDLPALKALLHTYKVCCATSGTSHWTDIQRLQLMFGTQASASNPGQQEGTALYLRPETAQGIYVNFAHVQKSMRLHLPFGIAQVGKAFRNELIARQFTFRMREFEQMEMQFFVPPTQSKDWFAYWKKARMGWYETLGIAKDHLQLHPHDKLAHYAQAAEDITYGFPFGFKEVEGIHDRGEFDLACHMRMSGKKLTYFDPQQNKHYLPHVVEVSAGLDRLCLMLLCECYTEERTSAAGKRIYMRFPAALAPLQAAILPLVKKDGIAEKARQIFEDLRSDFDMRYEEDASIGKRYTRQDLIGTPFCFTVDYQSLEDQTLTVRERDTTQQSRLPIQDIPLFLRKHTAMSTLLDPLKTWLKNVAKDAP